MPRVCFLQDVLKCVAIAKPVLCFSAYLTGQRTPLLSDHLDVHGDPHLARSVCLCVCYTESNDLYVPGLVS